MSGLPPMIMERLVDFLRQLLIRHDDLKKGQDTMTATTQQILDKLTAQGAQIDSLIAARDAKEQADLDQINTLIDTNGAKVASAFAPGSTGQAPDPTATITATVASPTSPGSITIPVSPSALPAIVDAVNAGVATVSGPGIASGATVTGVSTSASTISISTPTTMAHVGDGSETLTVTPPAAS